MIEDNKKKYLKNRIVDQMAMFLVEDFSLSIPEALHIVYSSGVYELLNNDENELYIQSSLYVYEMLKKEYFTAKY